MNHSPLSDQTLAQARAELARLRPGPALDAEMLARLTQLQAHLQAQADPVAEPRWLRRLAWGSGLAGAATALLMSLMLLVDPPGSAAVGVARADSGFIPLVTDGELRRATAREAAVWLQPAELPRERLALLGLPFDAARADEPVRAELMVHASGQVLAVRLLP